MGNDNPKSVLAPRAVAAVIHVQDLCKSVNQKPILTDVSFHLEAGDLLALLGENGSGKTLLLKILATLTRPTSGTVTIAGYDAFTNLREVRPLIGYVPETFDGYPNLSVREYLEFFASAYKLESAQRSVAIQDVLDLMDLVPLREQKIERLSVGQKHRLCLAKTFLHDPLIWLLDLPFSVLDARGRIEMEALIQELSAIGKTVILATHHLADVANVCSHVGILAGGSFAVFGEVGEISRQMGERHRLEIEVAQGIDIAQEILENRSEVISLDMTGDRIQIESQMSDAEIAGLLKDLIHAGVMIYRFQKAEKSLEDLFLDVTSPTTTNEGT